MIDIWMLRSQIEVDFFALNAFSNKTPDNAEVMAHIATMKNPKITSIYNFF